MSGTTTSEERTWAMLCHLGVLGGHLIPFGNLIIPLVLWAIKKDGSDYIDYHGKESINFQISLTIYFAVTFLLAFVLVGFLIMLPLWIFSVIVVIIAGLKANEGEYYRYPLSIRFIK